MIDLESKVFERSHLDIQRLLAYGFKKTAQGYRYRVDILDKEFRVELFLSFSGQLHGEIFETMTGDAYRNIWIEGMDGAFVGKVREAYGQVLQAVRQHCYVDDDFSTAQANRIAALIQEKYGTRPEFLWKSAPQHGVFRNQQNQKWFGIIMYVEQAKITAGEEKDVGFLFTALFLYEHFHWSVNLEVNSLRKINFRDYKQIVSADFFWRF